MSERKPLQLTIKLPRPIITGSSVGSEEVSGTTTTSSTTPRCTGRTRHPRLRAPFSPQTVRTTEISGQESHFIRLLGFIKKVWKCESGKGSACILSYYSKLISQIVQKSNPLQIRGWPASASPAAPTAAADIVLNTASGPQPVLEILPATPLRKGPRGPIHCRPARPRPRPGRRRRCRLLKLTGSSPDGTGGSRGGGSGGSCRLRTDSLSTTLRRSNGLLQQGRPF